MFPKNGLCQKLIPPQSVTHKMSGQNPLNFPMYTLKKKKKIRKIVFKRPVSLQNDIVTEQDTKGGGYISIFRGL